MNLFVRDFQGMLIKEAFNRDHKNKPFSWHWGIGIHDNLLVTNGAYIYSIKKEERYIDCNEVFRRPPENLQKLISSDILIEIEKTGSIIADNHKTYYEFNNSGKIVYVDAEIIYKHIAEYDRMTFAQSVNPRSLLHVYIDGVFVLGVMPTVNIMR